MIKIIALNEAVNNENEDKYANTLTKEAQEQVALSEYNRALELLITNKKQEALNVLNELLNTELLDTVDKPQIRDGRSRPMVSLKYSCFKNIASIQAELQNYHNALYNYWEAANLDDTDVVLWFRIGLMAIKISSLDVACFAFKQGLQINCNHWPCLDNIITVLYAIPDFMNCLLYISLALEKDPTYIKGLAFRQQIFKNIPAFQECYKTYNSSWNQDPSLDTDFDQAVGFVLLNEAEELNRKWINISKLGISKKCSIDLLLSRALSQYSWLELGRSLVDMHKYINDNHLGFINHITLNVFKGSNPIFKDNISTTCTEFYQQKEIPIQNIYFTNDKINPNSSIIRTNFNISTEHDSNLIKTDEMLDKNKSCINELLVFEENNVIPIEIFDVKKLSINNSSIFESEMEKNIIYTKHLDNTYLNVKDNVVAKCTSEEISHNFNTKHFENDDITIKLEKEKGQKVKKRRRSSLCFLTQWAWSNNNIKRSTRARTCGRKDYERDGVLLEEILKRIFPSTLLPDNTKFTKKELLIQNDDSIDTSDIHNVIMNKENTFTDDTKSTESSKSTSPSHDDHLKYFGTEQEATDTKDFIDEHNNKYNIIIIIVNFLKFLSTKWNYKWPNELSELYIQLYNCTRKHVPHFSSFIKYSNDIVTELDAETTLLFCELYTDKWLSSKSCNLPTCSLNKLGIGISSDDLGYLIFYSNQSQIYNEKNINFLLRLLWLKANIFLYQGDTEISIKTLELLLDHMHKLKFELCKSSFKLMNCKFNSTVSIKAVRKMLTFIQRGKKFCEIKHLYHEKKYEELSHILKETFHFSKYSNQFLLCKEVPVDRVEHLHILLDTLWQLQQYEDCYVWAEACLNESWSNYLHTLNVSLNENDRSKWIRLVLYSLEQLEACVMEVSTFIVRYLTEFRRSRLVQNLVHIVCHQLDVSDNITSMPIESVSPWILLHFILQYEEDKERAKSAPKLRHKSFTLLHSDEDDDEEFPPSITILLKAHEFLGRHGWCCINEGKLLLFILKLIVPKLNFPLYALFKRKLKESIEQIIYCLYGHPSKFNSGARSKPKYIDEHVKTSINLSWETCQLLFDFYKPEILPSFESKRVDSINMDTVILFKKICSFIPSDSDPTKISEEMNSYLLGAKENIPCVKKLLPIKISYIYYLIADHYFKAASNQSWLSAVKYYILDLCLHPNELNSWAGLAMSTSTLMESWLNNFQPNINEEKYLAKAKIAQRSYQHAIRLGPSHVTIWTEFGNFLYTVHSFCSRLLKQESDSLNMKKFRILENQKEEMLDEAKHCFISANNIYSSCQAIDECQDERWLYQYMLAKIAEKKNEDPPVFLKYYSKARSFLNESKAQYPKRINHKNPQNLSIEALEVYYRIHASILKYLDQHEGEPLKKSLAILLETNLKNCMHSPFMLYNSIFNNLSTKHDNFLGKVEMTVNKQLQEVKSNEIFASNSQPTVMNKSVINNKSDIRKRYLDEPITISGVKKMKLGSVSHLQLMQDVVALIDDLITKVCSKVSSIKYQDSESNSLINCNNMSSIVLTTQKKSIQHFLNDARKHKIEFKEEKREMLYNDKDNVKLVGNWFPNENLQMELTHKSDKIDEMKKIVKLERTLSRRSSQESTTTTHTSTSGTNNSSSSSSDDSTTTDDSSDSSTSSDTDSDSLESNSEKKRGDSVNEYTYAPEVETTKLIEYCLSGLEQCILRFPEHYKSIYRLAYFFFYNKVFKNIVKCKQLLLGTYECQFYKNQKIQGLFSERKNANFFNGIWRIPIHEIDRPGSFASHMSRCIVLLMQVLKETGDSRMLIELCIQLRKIPDTDKKYLRDSEREQLSCQALTLCLQCLRNRIKSMNVQNISIQIYNTYIDERINVLLDIYHVYQNIKNMPEYEILELPKVRKLLEDAYVLYIANSNVQGNVFELAKECCRQKLRANKIGLGYFDSNINSRQSRDNTILSAENTNFSSLSIPFLAESRKSQKVSITGRPRGRPPGVNKFPQIMNSNSLLIQNQYNSKDLSTSSTYVSNSSTLSNNPCCLTPFLEPNMLAAMLESNFNTNIIDSAINYLNQAGACQSVFSKYKNNVNTLPDLEVKYKKNSTNEKFNNTETNLGITDNPSRNGKQKPDISITPVARNKPQIKSKSMKLSTINYTQNKNSSTSTQLRKADGTSNLKLPFFQSSQTLNVSQCLSKHEVSLKTNSLSLDSKNSNFIDIPQMSQTTIAAVSLNNSITRPGTSLQHKLLSKKQNQYSNQSLGILKQKQTKTFLPNNYANLFKTSSTPLKSKDSTIISVNASPLNSSKYIHSPSNSQKLGNTKIAEIPISNSSLQDINTAHTLSVLSHLQQHSHLEIIPQTNHVKLDNNLMNIPAISGTQNLVDSMKLLSAENISVYELPKSKISSNYTTISNVTKRDKSEKDDVEIITLDD